MGALFAQLFMSIDTADNSLGIDNIFYALDNWNIQYDVVNGLRNPPWSVLPLIPIGSLLPVKAAWGVLVYITLIVSVASVPRTRNRAVYFLAVLAAVASFPVLRNIADANLEGLLIAGALLVVAGYQRKNPYILAVGVLLVTIKPQACFMLMPVLALVVLRTWPREKWLKALSVVLAVVIPTTLWRGERWLAAVGGTYQAGSIIDISLRAALRRTEVVPEAGVWLALGVVALVTLWTSCRTRDTLSREKVAMLMVASMLLSPYTAGNTVATALVVGVIAMFVKAPKIGGVFILLINLPYPLLGTPVMVYQSYWWTLILLTLWAVLNWRVIKGVPEH